MLRRIVQCRLPVFNSIKHVAIISIALTSCFDFEFESEYEDINGIYVEFTTYYLYGGRKLLFTGDTGYIIHNDSLLAYDFTNVDSVYLLGTYLAGHEIADFLIEDEHAFLVLPAEGLQIVDISDTQPQIVSTLALQFPEIIQKIGNFLYIAALHDFIIVDVTEKANPILISSYAFDNSIKDLEIDSNFAYVLSEYDIQILNIGEPSTPNLTYSMSFTDSLWLTLFAKKGSYLYVSAWRHPVAPVLITCALTIDRNLHKVSEITCPYLIHFINTSGEYCLAVCSPSSYLINLEYPAQPCIGELISTPGPVIYPGTYGIIRNDYIYILDGYWGLNIFEIKHITQ